MDVLNTIVGVVSGCLARKRHLPLHTLSLVAVVAAMSRLSCDADVQILDKFSQVHGLAPVLRANIESGYA